MNLLLECDPLPDYPFDEISSAVQQGYIKKEDAIIHMNLTKFVTRATEENKDFYNLTKDERYKLLLSYVEEYKETIDEPRETIEED